MFRRSPEISNVVSSTEPESSEFEGGPAAGKAGQPAGKAAGHEGTAAGFCGRKLKLDALHMQQAAAVAVQSCVK